MPIRRCLLQLMLVAALLASFGEFGHLKHFCTDFLLFPSSSDRQIQALSLIVFCADLLVRLPCCAAELDALPRLLGKKGHLCQPGAFLD